MGSVYSELNGDLTGRTDNALDLAAFITLHAVTVLLDRTSHPELEIFRIFDEAIGMLVRLTLPVMGTNPGWRRSLNQMGY